MTQTVYTKYWINKRDGVRKRHGHYKTEEDALQGIKAWWEIHNEDYEPKIERTNSGALEIAYIDDNYFYRIEEEEIEGKLPKTSYKLLKKGEIQAKRAQLNLDEESHLFDELAEPFRDRLIQAMADPKEARQYIYTSEGEMIRKIES
ncbi:hypothetical protein [Atopococcus tabaci]|uniref:hypothetical protein n=1 Tax=Atopococcus tabaci TaxID=269774 RepID=UPI0003F9E1EA|nr:hypothetical protein [Atopococcus tabaci]